MSMDEEKEGPLYDRAKRGMSWMQPAALELEQYMSELSEEAYCAGWMTGLEYALWNAVINGPRDYGRLPITDAHISKLKELSNRCGGWIVFDDETEETFIPLQEWQQKYEAARSSSSFASWIK